MEKIILQLPADAWHGYATETVWAEKVGADRYRVRSVPFYAKGVSNEDIVVTASEDGKRVVTGVVLRGGHSTYRIFLSESAEFGQRLFDTYWRPLAEIGCTLERATNRLLAIDIPPLTSINEAYKLLERGERAGVWNFEEGHYARS